MLLLQLLPQMLMVVLIMSDSTYGHIGCTAVSTARETTVTCLFEKDISQKDFSVHRYHTSGSGGEMVLACNRQPSGGLICDKRRDTKFDDNQRVTNQLILTRPSSNNTQRVQYQCEIVPSEDDLVQRCDLIYKASPAILSVTTTKASISSQAVDDSDPLDVAALVIIIFLIVAMLIICVTCYINRKSCLYDRIRKICFGTINEHWPGAMGDLEKPPSPIEQNSTAATSLKKEMPKGLPTLFYNMGWEDAMKEEERKRAAYQKESPKQEQQNQDKAQPDAKPKQGGGIGFPFNIIAGRGQKQDPQKEQRKKKDKGDPDREANEMESASAGDPMLDQPPSSTNKGGVSLVVSGAAAQREEVEEFYDAESAMNEESQEERPGKKKKKKKWKRLSHPFSSKKKGEEDQQENVSKAEPQGDKRSYKGQNEEVIKKTTEV